MTSLDHFAAKLRFETDPADLHAALAGPERPAVVDSRGPDAWRQGRLPGAVHLPTARIPGAAAGLLDPAVPVVVYCWGPGCNGSAKAALALARLGYEVRDLIGGFEYWAREGLPVESDGGIAARPADPLTAPVGPHCDC